MGTAGTLGNRFLSATGSRTLAIGYRRYGWPTLAVVELIVQCEIAISEI